MFSKASPQMHLTEFFSVDLLPILPRCLLQTSTTSGSSSYQSIKSKPLEIHSLATPPSPPPMIAARSHILYLILETAFTNVELYKASSLLRLVFRYQ